MQESVTYEEYPLKIPLISISLTIAVYGIGTYILAGFGILWALLYMLYCILIEISVLRGSCVNCWYYGKRCGLGRGKLCAKLFKKGDPQKFSAREISWIQIIPDFLVIIFPIVGSIILLILAFNLTLLMVLIILIILYFVGNAFVRGMLTCKYCKQRELGCPAAKMFNKEKE